LTSMTPPMRAIDIGTPLGDLLVVMSPDGVLATTFHDDELDLALDRMRAVVGNEIDPRGRGLAAVGREIDRYFRGTLRAFATRVDLSLATPGFPRLVLASTVAIPYGQVMTYGDVADAAGARRGGRAAGNALSRSPIELFVPCHRVVHAGGTIGGNGRHDDRKRWLLRHEGAIEGRSTRAARR
jgi:methylated-DNA-[protein]-cysteine S-methyltransferase